MEEIKIISGKHKCGKKMDMRIVDVKDDNQNIFSWIIYGICKKCNTVLVSNLFMQKEEPLLDRDFIIDCELVSEETEQKGL